MAGKAWASSKVGPRRPVHDNPEYEDLSDPANGERVPRCGSCGHPGPIELVGLWGGLRGHFPLCEPCWRHFNPPDPLRP